LGEVTTLLHGNLQTIRNINAAPHSCGAIAVSALPLKSKVRPFILAIKQLNLIV